MTKFNSVLNILIPLLLVQSGCSLKNDIRKDSYSYKTGGTSNNYIAHNLNELEELYDNMDYNTVINNYSQYMPETATITRFRYYVIFSLLDDIHYLWNCLANQFGSMFPTKMQFYLKLFESMFLHQYQVCVSFLSGVIHLQTFFLPCWLSLQENRNLFLP